MKTASSVAENLKNLAPTSQEDLPNIASESLQTQFIDLCSSLGLTPRQAILLGHIWFARAEHKQQLVNDSIAGFIEFSPDVLPCKGECRQHKIAFSEENKG